MAAQAIKRMEIRVRSIRTAMRSSAVMMKARWVGMLAQLMNR